MVSQIPGQSAAALHAARQGIQSQQDAHHPIGSQTMSILPADSPYHQGGVTDEPESYKGGIVDTRASVAWDKCNLLTLDGGGIRGYWSLLVLQELMVCIAESERKHDPDVDSSFHPDPWKDAVSQVPMDDDEREFARSAELPTGTSSSCHGPRASRRYLPCHYFDYIGGSSTGGLIAIMLGRLRMTVLDCLEEYERLGQKVFGAPRLFCSVRLAFVNRTKYSAKTIRRVFEDIAARRGERGADVTTFKSKPHTCKTFVTTIAKRPNESSSRLYLIRSYDFHGAVPGARAPRQDSSTYDMGPSSRSATGLGRVTNEGPAHDFQLWKVARAATAAPFYFDPLEIETGAEKGIKFTDGGFGKTNNPTKEGIKEVREGEGADKLGCVVSIGTARHPQTRTREQWFIGAKVKSLFRDMTDPETIHEEVKRKADRHRFAYFRLNPRQESHLLTMELDEWSPKYMGSAGSSTIKQIKEVFNRWYTETHAVSYFQRCADMLVTSRRMRSQDTRLWKRFALVAEFTCRLDCRKKGTGFSDIEEFGNHLHERHGLSGEDLDKEIVNSQRNFEYNPRRDSHRSRKKGR